MWPFSSAACDVTEKQSQETGDGVPSSDFFFLITVCVQTVEGLLSN